MATKFEPAETKAYKKAKKAEGVREESQHSKAARSIAKEEVGKHVKAMHMAKGGFVARGGGAARKSALKFTRNG